MRHPLAIKVCRAAIKSWRIARARVKRAEATGDTSLWMDRLDFALVDAEFQVIDCMLLANGRNPEIRTLFASGEYWEPAKLCLDGVIYLARPTSATDSTPILTERPAHVVDTY